MFEQLRAEASPTVVTQDRSTELGDRGCLRRVVIAGAIGEVRHGHQCQVSVEDPEHLIAIESQRVHIVSELLVAGRKTEAQVTVVLVQSTQVSDDARAMALRQ